MHAKQVAVWLVILTTLLTTSAQLLFKQGSARLPIIATNWPLFLGIIAYGLGAVILIYALKQGEVSTLYPITASSYIWVTLLAWWWFGESFSITKGVGLACIIAGVIMLGYTAQKTVQYVEPV